MTAWTADELRRVEEADELQISSRLPNGNLSPFITIWVVRAGDQVYVRSAHGHDNPWFQSALHSGKGRIRTRALERDVAFLEPGPDLAEPVTAAYHAKYDRYGPQMVGTVVSEEAVRSTLRVEPT